MKDCDGILKRKRPWIKLEFVYLPRAQHGGEENVALPLLASEHLVDPGGDVAGGGAEADVEDEGAGHERAAVGGREEAEAGEDQGHARHGQDLAARAQEDREQHSWNYSGQASLFIQNQHDPRIKKYLRVHQ